MTAPPESVSDLAIRLLAAGVSVIPIRPDGSKAPAVREWKGAQERPYSPTQARQAWSGTVRGIAAVCGAVSGGLECLDFDLKTLFDVWAVELERAAPGLLRRLVITDTPDGVHCWYRSAEIEGNQKLARDAAGKTVVETRGEGGYAILPGSPAVCHPTNREYAYRQGHLAEVGTVTEGERAVMLDLARALNEFAELPKGAARPPEAQPGEMTPWDDFDQRGPAWADILEPCGWRLVSGTWASGYLARPGQERAGWAGTIGKVQSKGGAVLFHPFSANAGLPVGSYGKARAWIQLHHRGDYKAAAKALRQLGYGSAAKPPVGANGQAHADSSNGHAPALPWATKPAGSAPEAGISAADLVDLELPEPRFAVPGLLCEGLNLLGGRPKQGKSWLSLLLAWAAAGGQVLDGRACDGGDVLYLALEDTRRRLKSRLRTLGPALGWAFPRRLEIRTSWPRAAQGGLYYLAEWLEAHRGTARLVIIDTLAKFRSGRKGNGNTYDEDYEALSQIQALAHMYDVAILVIHHTRKQPAEDPFDELSGTLAIAGAPDGLLILDRKRGADEAKLFVTGRDVPESTVPLTLDRTAWRWTLGPAADGIDTGGRHISPASNRVDQCCAWLREFLDPFAYPSAEIAKAAKEAGYSFDALKQAKARLGRDGSGELANANFGGKGTNDWWSGLGPVDAWTKRPVDQVDRRRPAGRPADSTPDAGPDIWPG